jgi:hypothetical protein
MRNRITFAAWWAVSVTGAAAVQHLWLGAPVDAAFLLLATVSAGATLAFLQWLERKARERADAQALHDRQIAFLVTEAVRQRRALDRVERAGLISEAEIEALENRSECRVPEASVSPSALCACGIDDALVLRLAEEVAELRLSLALDRARLERSISRLGQF